MTLPPPKAKPPEAKGSAPPGTSGLAAWWKFDETVGALAADASDQRRDGHVQGPPRWTAQGRVGGALELDGKSNWVDCGDAASFDFREAMTLSLWLKLRTSEKSAATLVSKGNNTWLLQLVGDKRTLNFDLTGPQTTGKNRGRAPSLKAKRPVDDGQWHHVAAVYDGQRVALYLDGELEDSVTASGPMALNTEPVTLGQTSMSRSRPFNGWMDDVRLLGRGLSAQEVQALYRIGAK